MSRAILFAVAMCISLQASAEPVSFTREIAPILVRNCQSCHGARTPKGDYRLLTFEQMQKPGDSESAPVTPGKPAESYLFSLITATDDSRMPKKGEALAANQIEIVKRWIEEGATYDGISATAPFASIVPKLADPDPPVAYRRPFPVTAIAFHPSANQLAVSGYHEVTIWNPTNGALLGRIKNVPERVHGLAYTPDGKVLAVAGGQSGVSGEIKLFDPADGALLKDLLTTGDVCFRLAISPAGNKLAVACADRAIRIYDIATGKLDRTIDGHADWVTAVGWSFDGKRIASASRDRSAKVFRTDTGELITAFTQSAEPLNAVAFLPEGNLVASAGQDKRLRRWNANDGKQEGSTEIGREVLDVIVSGEKIYVACADGTIEQLRGKDCRPFRTYDGHGESAYALAYDPATDRLAAGCFNGEVRIIQAEDGKELLKFFAAPGYSAPAK